MALSLTADPYPATRSVLLTITNAAENRTNLITNPSFEVGATTGWGGWGGATLTAPTSATAEWGTKVGRAALSAATFSGFSWVTTGLAAGVKYGFRARARVLDAAFVIRARVQFLDGSGTQLAITDGADVAATVAGWVTLSVEATAPAGTTQARLFVVRPGAGTAGHRIDVDAALFRAVPGVETFDPDDYFDGDQLNCQWDGTPQASTSSRTTDAVEVTRTDSNGTDVPVRQLLDASPSAGFLSFGDFEAALVGPLEYTVTDAAGRTATASTALDLEGSPALIHDVQLPTGRAVAPDQLTGYEAAAGVDSVVHWPVNRSTPVVVTGATRRTRQGRLTAWCATHAEAVALLAVAVPGRPLMLRQGDHPGLDMYFQALEATTRPEELLDGGWCWAVEVDYVETAYPPGAVIE